jgi:NADPH oxidase
MPPKPRFSGLSFDSGPAIGSFLPTDPSTERNKGGPTSGDEDRPLGNGPTFLSRNKTERARLQGLTRTMSNPASDIPGAAKQALGMAERFKVWMVNEGELRWTRGPCPADGQAATGSLCWYGLSCISWPLRFRSYTTA